MRRKRRPPSNTLDDGFLYVPARRGEVTMVLTLTPQQMHDHCAAVMRAYDSVHTHQDNWRLDPMYFAAQRLRGKRGGRGQK